MCPITSWNLFLSHIVSLPALQCPVILDALDDRVEDLVGVRDVRDLEMAIAFLHELDFDGHLRHKAAVVGIIACDEERRLSSVALALDALELGAVVLREFLSLARNPLRLLVALADWRDGRRQEEFETAVDEDEIALAALLDVRFHEGRVVAEEPVLRILSVEPLNVARENLCAAVIPFRDDRGKVSIALHLLRVMLSGALHELVQRIFRRAGRLVAVTADTDGHEQEDHDRDESLPAIHK